MASKQLSKKKLTEQLNKLPAPVVQHLKRCKKLAEFVLEKAKVTDWYLALNINESELLSAISFHDFGKAYIHKDYVHLQHCENKKERAEYFSHVEKALDYIAENSTKYRTANKSFDKYLYDCIQYHHTNYDGTGHVEGLVGNEIPFIARLCAIVDAFDNHLNLGSVSTISFDEAYDYIKVSQNTIFDARLCELFIGEKEVLRDFCENLFTSDKRKRESKYGAAMRYIPIYKTDSKILVGLEVALLINDPYFGLVPSEVFLPVAERSESIVQLNRITRYRALKQAELFIRHNVDFKCIRIVESIRTLAKKSYANELKKLLYVYEVPMEKIAIGVSDQLLTGESPEAINTVKALIEMGVYVYIYDFGNKSSSFNLFEELRVNEIILSKTLSKKSVTSKASNSILQGFIGIAKELGIAVSCAGVETYEEERLFEKMGIDFVCGKYYSEPKTAYAIEKEFGASEGE